jgi:hypothetical protein
MLDQNRCDQHRRIIHRSLVLATVRLCVCEQKQTMSVRTNSAVTLPARPLPGAGRLHARGSRSSIDAIDIRRTSCSHGAGGRMCGEQKQPGAI